MQQRAEVETSETTPTPDSTQREVPEEEAGEKESKEMLERKIWNGTLKNNKRN